MGWVWAYPLHVIHGAQPNLNHTQFTHCQHGFQSERIRSLFLLAYVKYNEAHNWCCEPLDLHLLSYGLAVYADQPADLTGHSNG